MKKQLFSMLCALLLLNFYSHAQTGSSCSTPFVLASPVTNQTQTTLTSWYQFTIADADVEINFTNATTTAFISNVEVYTGPCNDLRLLAKFNAFAGASTNYIKHLATTPGIIYVKTTKNSSNTTAANFSFTLVTSNSNDAEHTLIVCNNGQVSAFGSNSHGQLGVGSSALFITDPQNIPGLNNVVAVSYGSRHSMALTGSGQVYCWGDNQFGACGQNTAVSTYNTPQLVTFPVSSPVVAIAAGGYHCLALLANGSVYSWGWNSSGQLGDGTLINRPAPVLVQSISGVTKMAAGRVNSYFIMSNKTIRICGDNQAGQSGNGTISMFVSTAAPANTLNTVIAACAGERTIHVLLEDGSVWSWGENSDGEAGHPSSVTSQLTPAQVPGFGPGCGIRDIASGCKTTSYLHTDGRIFITGWTGDCQGGAYSLPNTQPTLYGPTLTGIPVMAADMHSSCVAHHVVFFCPDGAVSTVGANRRGQLGTATNLSSFSCAVQYPATCKALLPSTTFSPSPTSINCSGPQTSTLTAATATTINAPNIVSWKIMQLQPSGSSYPVISNNNAVTQTITNTTGYLEHCIIQRTSEPTVPQAFTTVTRTDNLCCGTPAITVAAGSNSSTVFGANATVSNTTIVINGTLTVNSGLTFNNCVINMAAGSQITVNTGQTLTITNYTHLFSCGNMWNGIRANTGSTVNINTHAFIEDAIIAVQADGGAVYAINGAVFNRNQTGVRLQNTTGNYSGTITGSIFTCREIPTGFTVPQLQPILYQLDRINLKAPNNTTFSSTAVRIAGSFSQIPVLSIGSNTASKNVFDAHSYGVYSNYGAITVKNNIFQFLTGATPISGTSTGIGVLCSQTAGSAISQNITIGTFGQNQGNLFYDCFRAIQIEYARNITADNNQISASMTFLPLTGNNKFGDAGIHLTVDKSDVISVRYNIIKNYSDAIRLSRTAAPVISNDFEYNSITADICGELSLAIFLNDPTNNTFNGPLNHTKIRYNTITEANYGIRVNNVKKDLIISDNNEIGIRYSASGPRNGIWLTNCNLVQIKNNNNIHSSNRINDLVRGIFIQTSRNNYIACNTIFNVGQCLTFEGACFSSTGASTPNYPVGILSNSFNNATDGFILRTNGDVQTQGTSTQPTGNTWGTNFIRSQTLADNTTTTNANSVLFNLSGLQPTNNVAINGGSQYTGVGLQLSIGTIPSCPSALAPPTSPLVSTLSVTTPFANELDSILSDSTFLPNWYAQTLLRRQAYVFNSLQADTSLCLASNSLQQFHTNCVNGNAGTFYTINEHIAATQFQTARQLNNNISPANLFEQNQKLINDLMLRRFINPVFTYSTLQRNQLNNLAAQCAETGGPAVHQARAWIDHINGTCTIWTDNCPTQPASNQRMPAREIKTVGTAKLFPNPATQQVTLNWNLTNEKPALLTVYNVQGEIVISQSLNTQTGSQIVDLNTLAPGVYLWKVVQGDAIIESDKLIVY